MNKDGVKKYWARALIIFVMVCGSLVTGSGVEAQSGDPAPSELQVVAPLQVVATTGMVADLAREVGGSLVAVTALMGPGVDPHLYRATHSDLRSLESAELVLYNGLHLEGKLSQVLHALARRKPCIPVAENIPPERLRAPPEFEGNFDPHVWFDLKLWEFALDATVDALSAARPTGEAIFRGRAAAYQARLDATDQWIRTQIATIPVSQRVLITAHDAFGYFGRAYGIEVHGLQGISTATEYGLHDVAQLVELVVSRKIPALFVESSVPQRFVVAIQEGARARSYEVRLGGELYSDAMGSEGTPEGHFIGMIAHNVRTITHALGGVSTPLPSSSESGPASELPISKSPISKSIPP